MRRYMKFYILYKKELKQIRSALFVLCIVYLSIFLYALTLNSLDPKINYISLIFLLIAIGILWAGPFVFAYSLHEEWKCKTVYQLHSLPIHRCTMMITKYLVGVLICALTIVGTNVCYYLFTRNMSFVNIPDKISTFTLFAIFAMKSLSLLALLSGIACGTMGVALSVKRYRWTFGAVVCTLMFYATYKFDNFFKHIIFSYSSRIETNLLYDSHPAIIVMGFVFMIFGLILYEKYTEV